MAFGVPAPVAGLLGIGSPGESWEDRLREAAYTSPSGTRILFDYEEVSREFTLRGTAFEFPGVDDAYVQRRGFGPRRYPLRCFFSGKDHDLIAKAFERALLEPGTGKLEHPRHGTFNVVPFGDVTTREDLKSAANQTVVEVTFWTTTGAVYPSASIDHVNEILAALDGFDVTAAQQFAATTKLAGALDQANAKATIRKFLRNVSSSLQKVSDQTASVRREFADTTSLINESVDVLIGQPLALALQISNLIKAPGRALAGLQSRLDGYADLATSIFGELAARPGDTLVAGVSLASRTTRVANDFRISDLFATAAVAGAVVSVTNNAYSTKVEAMSAADAVLGLFDAVVSWRDGGFGALADVPDLSAGIVDTGEAYQAMQAAVAAAAGYLIQVSFSLKPERSIVLDRDRTIIDLAAQLYGEVDGKLDDLINNNELTGDEILELPRGKKILYYV